MVIYKYILYQLYVQTLDKRRLILSSIWGAGFVGMCTFSICILIKYLIALNYNK